jgi:hypothetical protein
MKYAVYGVQGESGLCRHSQANLSRDTGGIVSHYSNYGQNVKSEKRPSLCHHIQNNREAHSAFCPWGLGDRMKLTNPPPTAVVKNAWSYAFTPTLVSVKHKEHFSGLFLSQFLLM